MPTNGPLLAMMTFDREVVVLNGADGTEKLRVPAPKAGIFSQAHLQFLGNTLYLAEADTGPSLGNVINTLSALNLDTGEWSWSISQNVRQDSSPTFGGDASVSIYQDEIRVTYTNDGDSYGGLSDHITRWRLSDRSALPPLYFDARKKSAGPVLEGLIGIPMSDRFCAGYSGGLVFESGGVSTIKAFPVGFRAMHPSYATTWIWHTSSPSYLAIRAIRGADETENGFLIWRTKNPDAEPRYIKLLSRTANPFFTIIEDRYLWVVSKDPGNPHDGPALLRVIDLSKPDEKPTTVTLPTGFPMPSAMGLSGNDIWFSNYGARGRITGAASRSMLAVHVEDTVSSEAEGMLKFRVHADKPLIGSIRVHLQSHSGTATTEEDYTGFDGWVTLTPKQPEAWIKIPVTKDMVIEGSESMTLEITSIDGAWIGRRIAKGVIDGGGFPVLRVLNGPPGSKGSYRFMDWAMTPAGVVAGVGTYGQHAYYILKHGQSDWQPVHSISGLNGLSTDDPGIISAYGNKLAVKSRDTDSTNYSARKLTIADVESDQRLLEVHDFHDSISLNSSGWVSLENANILRGHPLDVAAPNWEQILQNGDARIRVFGMGSFSEDLLAHGDDSQKISLRRLSDGNLVRQFPRIPTSNSSLLDAKNGFWVATSDAYSEFLVIGNNDPDNFPAQFITNSYSGSIATSFLTEQSTLVLQHPNLTMDLIDCRTGARLATLSGQGTTSMAASAGCFGVLTAPNELTVHASRPPLPGPARSKFTRTEGDSTTAWTFGLAEKAPFPVTIRVISGNDDIIPTASVTIPTGADTAPFPAQIVGDSIPENEELHTIQIEVSGNGASAIYPIEVTVPLNQQVRVPTPKGGHLITGASSMFLHPSGIAVGSIAGGVAVDPRYNVVQKSSDKNLQYGFAITCNKSFMAVGAPNLINRGKFTGRVFLYDRKSGRLKSSLVEPKKGSVFGSVLHLDDKRLYVGAPGYSTAGSAMILDLSSLKTRNLKGPGTGVAQGRFGAAIASAGDSVWIGEPKSAGGKIHQFNASTGKHIRTISAPEAGYENFGTAITIIGSRLLVGAPSLKRSAVFFFNSNTGKPIYKLACPFDDGAYFGISMTVPKSGLLAVGCPASRLSSNGGILLYDTTAKAPQLVTMLRPEVEIGKLHGMGGIGNITGAGSILGITTHNRALYNDIVSFTDNLPKHSIGAVIDLSKLLPRMPATVAKSSKVALGAEENLWQSALGPGADANDIVPELEIGPDAVTVSLPELPGLAEGFTIIMEKSPDLHVWERVASIQGGQESGWILDAASATIHGDSLRLPFPPEANRWFFRLKCVGP